MFSNLFTDLVLVIEVLGWFDVSSNFLPIKVYLLILQLKVDLNCPISADTFLTCLRTGS